MVGVGVRIKIFFRRFLAVDVYFHILPYTALFDYGGFTFYHALLYSTIFLMSWCKNKFPTHMYTNLVVCPLEEIMKIICEDPQMWRICFNRQCLP